MGKKQKIYSSKTVKNKNSNRMGALIFLCAISAILLIAEIYAWFNTQQNVSISNLQAKVQVAEGLQISLDAASWSQEINLGTANIDANNFLTSANAIWNTYDAGIGNIVVNNVSMLSRNIRPKKANSSETGYMTPMSTTGIIGSNNKIIKMFSGELQGSKLSEIRQANTNEVLDDNVLENINALCQEGYYAFDIYLMNTSASDENTNQLQLNSNSIVQEILSSADTDYGLKNCVRVAFALYNDTAEINDSQSSIVEKTYNSEISQVAIWEPNYDAHSEYAKSSNSKMNEIVTLGNTITYAVNAIPESNVIDDVYLTSNLSLGQQKTIQTSSSNFKIVNMTDINSNSFNLSANKVSKMRIYIWLEGQDVDCVNWASHSNGINVTIGLTKQQETFDEGSTVFYDGKKWIAMYVNDDEIQMVSKDALKYDDGDSDGTLALGINDAICSNLVSGTEEFIKVDLDEDESLSDVEKTIYSYNHSIETLNKACESLILDKSKIATDENGFKIRSVGSNPTNRNSKNSNLFSSNVMISYSKFNGKGESGDTNYVTDVNKLNELGISKACKEETTTYVKYWLASRFVDYDNSKVHYGMQYISDDGTRKSAYLWYVHPEPIGEGGAKEEKYVRPVITIDTTKISGFSYDSENQCFTINE